MKNKLNPKKSLRSQLFLSFILPFILLGVLVFGFVNYLTNMIIDDHVLPQFDEILQIHGDTLANSIDETVITETIQNAQDPNGELVASLDSFMEGKEGIEYVYVLTKQDNVDYIVGLNGTADVMMESPFTAEQEQSFTEETTVLTSIYEDEWGVHKSYFVPLPNSDAIVGIDMDTTFIHTLNNTILLFQVVFFIISILIGAIVAYLFGNRLNRPIQSLLKSMKKISDGDLTEKISSNRQDEIGRLATNFEEMRLSLVTIIASVKTNSKNINGTSSDLVQAFDELSDASTQIAVGTSEEARASETRTMHIDSISQGFSVMSHKIQDVSEQTKQIDLFTKETGTYAEQGSIQMMEITEQINRIQQNGTTSFERVIVSITDQGLGIPAAEVNQLFQKFKRIDNSESRKIGGTGLGLAICKEIIDKHEGEIWVDSIEGQGSTFSFSVPLAAPKKEIAGAQDVSLSRVMLLEDDTSLALLLSDELKASGFSVVHHYKPDRAIEDAQNETFVSIVVDIMLGEDQNGWDVIRKLKESDQTNHIPIIVSSALDTDESKVKEFGVEAYLTKPYSPERLSEIIQSIVHRNESN